MSKSKKLAVLCGVFLVLCIVTFAISKYETRKEQIKNSDEIILSLESDDVTALSWEYDSEALSFHKDDTWLYDEDEAFPVDDEKIYELLEQFQEFGASFIIEEVEDFGQYGLDDPTCTIHITADSQEYEILLGAYSTMDSQRYVSIGDGNVYLVEDDPMEDFEVTISDLILHDKLPSFDTVDEIQFSGTEDYRIVYEEDSANTYCADDVYFTEGKPLDTSNVKSYLRTISGLGLTDYASYNVSQEELTAYGLDEPELTVTVDYTTEDEDGQEVSETFVLYVGRDQEELAAAKDSDEEDAQDSVTSYVRVGDSQIVYRITTSSYQALMAASYDDLRHKEVLTADFDDVLKVDISLEDKEYTITSAEEEDEKVWSYGTKEELDISDFETALSALEADSFTEEEATGKEEISLTVYLDNENYPEVRIVLYRYDGDSCLAVVDGEAFALVDRSAVVDLIEAVWAIVLTVE